MIITNNNSGKFPTIRPIQIEVPLLSGGVFSERLKRFLSEKIHKHFILLGEKGLQQFGINVVITRFCSKKKQNKFIFYLIVACPVLYREKGFSLFSEDKISTLKRNSAFESLQIFLLNLQFFKFIYTRQNGQATTFVQSMLVRTKLSLCFKGKWVAAIKKESKNIQQLKGIIMRKEQEGTRKQRKENDPYLKVSLIFKHV